MNIVFTGKLKETRKELEAEVERFGHQLEKRVTADTDLVVVGVREERFLAQGFSAVSKKEHEAKMRGIQIVRVGTIEDMLEYFV